MIDSLVSTLITAGINAIEASETDISTVDTADLVNDLFGSLVDGRVYPLHLPDGAALPSMVYQLVGQDYIEADGVKLGRVDRYVLSTRTTSFATLEPLTHQIATAVADAGAQVEITDAAADYEPEQKQYRSHIELEWTSLATASQALPAVMVYSIGAEAGDNMYDNAVGQRVTELFGLAIICDEADLEATRDAVQSAMLGLQVTPQAEPALYHGGNRLAQTGQLIYWREHYAITRYIRA
jgi:hypothetical protein